MRLTMLAACLALGACTTAPLIPPTATVAVAEAGTSVDLAYNVAAQAYITALPTMPAATKTAVKPLLIEAYAAVRAADQAQALGNATTVTAQVTTAMGLIGQVKTALGVAQ